MTSSATMDTGSMERHDVIVVGAGQAGLAASHHLARRGIDHAVLDAGARAGDAWRVRWDSLRLFTPAAIDGLPGMPFPAPAVDMPARSQMADYLVAYADRERLPVRFGVRVDGLDRDGNGFVLAAGERRFGGREVVVATGFLSAPRVPPFAGDLDPAVTQLHSRDYRNPASTPGDSVLLVGAGNSGVEIALELARAGRRTMLSGHSTFLPRIAQVGGGRAFFAFARRALTLDSPIGRRMHQRMGDHGTAPVIRVRPADLAHAGVERVGRVESVRDGRPMLAEGRVIDVDTVIWCTGFRPAFEWIHLPVLGPGGLPRHVRGIAVDQPGLSFVGLPFQTSFLSALVGGVDRDADEVVEAIAGRLAGPARPAAAQVAPAA